MNIVVVTEKPAVSRLIAPHARKHWPAANVVFVHMVPFINVRPSYPRGLKLHEFPYLSEPTSRLVPWDEWRCEPLALGADGSASPVRMGAELFVSADFIVCACDPDPTGVLAFSVLMEQVFGDDRAKACQTMTLHALDDSSIQAALFDLREFQLAAASNLEYARTKQYFDWNWNVNSLAVFGETRRRAGVPDDAPALSKYALQLLYAMRNQPPRTEDAVLTSMHHWQGTGRYKIPPGQWRPRLGSAASMATILENLECGGLFDRVSVRGRQCLSVSKRGHALLTLLHPDCEDADLPFRLQAWGETGASAKPAVDRYIRTVFGKQIRFMGRSAAHG